MACKRSPVRSRYSPPLAQIRVTNTVDFKSKSTVFLCLSASKFIAILQILCKIKVEVHMNLVSAINVYPADKLADDHLFCFKAGTIVQVCIRNQFFVQLRYVCHQFGVSLQFCTGFFIQSFQLRVLLFLCCDHLGKSVFWKSTLPFDYSQNTEKKFQGKIVHYAMTTNVSLLSIDKVEFLWKHDVHLVLSLDGPKEIQEKNRIYVGSKKSSYDVAVENLNHIRDKFPEYIKRMNINIVINPMDDLDVVYSVFQDGQVFSGIHALATTINDSTLKVKNCESERFAEQLEYHNFLLLLNELGVKSSRQVYPLSEVIIESAKKKLKNRYSATQSVPYETAPGGMCVPGVYKLFVTVDGKLLTCERTNEPSNAGYLGDLSGGIELDRALKMLNVAKLTERQCQNCWAFRYCTNCISHCDDGKDVNAKLRTMQCQKSRGNVYYTFRIMILLLNKKSLTLYRKESQ